MPTLLHALATPKVIVPVVVGAVAVGTVAAVVASNDSVQATVVDVVDGDTIDVLHDGAQHRVRLLNIDTPESVDPDQPVQCLGPEAAEYLEGWLPPGTSVRLEYDVERLDGYGRELAGVFLGERLINADIAREGLAVPIAVGENVRFLDTVRAAHAEAQQDGRGLYAEDIECTLPAQVAALEQAVAPAPMSSTASPADIAAAGEVIEESLLAAAALIDVLDADPAAFPLLPFDADGLAGLRARTVTAQAKLTSARAANDATLAEAEARVEAEARAAEEARRAAEEAARVAAEEAARRAAEEAAAQQGSTSSSRPPSSGSSSGGSRSTTPPSGSGSGGGTPAPAPDPAPAPAPAPAPEPAPAPAPAPTGGSDGYTGCRAYGPNGTSIDDQGRRYTKIDCVTRLPIG
ncbi:thermonuclease family protein [Geodermatophilus sp. SYSU D00766]